jgi:hypothetical protein
LRRGKERGHWAGRLRIVRRAGAVGGTARAGGARLALALENGTRGARSAGGAGAVLARDTCALGGRGVEVAPGPAPEQGART